MQATRFETRNKCDLEVEISVVTSLSFVLCLSFSLSFCLSFERVRTRVVVVRELLAMSMVCVLIRGHGSEVSTPYHFVQIFVYSCVFIVVDL